MNKKVLILLFVFLSSIFLQIKSSSMTPSISFADDTNCLNFEFQENVLNSSKENYLKTFKDYNSVPVGQIATNGDYVRKIALYTPESGTPVNLLPESNIFAEPVERVTKDYIANRVINQPVKYDTIPSKSVGRAISEGSNSIFSSNDFDGSSNSYSRSSRNDNRGSLIFGN